MGTSESLHASQGVEMEKPANVEAGQRYNGARLYGSAGPVAVVTRVQDGKVFYRYEGNVTRECQGELARPYASFVACAGVYLGPAPEAAPTPVFECSRCGYGTDGGLCAACAAHRASKILDTAAPALPNPRMAHDWSNPYCRLGPHVRNDIRLCVACGRSQENIEPDAGCTPNAGWRERWEQTISRAMEARKPPAPANQEAGSQRELARPQGHSLLCGGVFSLREVKP